MEDFMEDYMEFDIVVHQWDKDVEKLENMGIDAPKEEKIVKYLFKSRDIVEIRQSFVEYLDENYDAVVVSYNVGGTCYVTPPLLVSYDNFKIKYDEYYKKGAKTY